MASKNLKESLDGVLKDFRAVAIEAVQVAAKDIQKDIVKEAYRCLAKYYANYDPNIYKRTKSLHKSITPIFEDHSSANEISIKVGVEFDPSKLMNAYYSNSRYHKSGTKWISWKDDGFSWHSGNNGVPEPEWIVDNFLKGIHPWAKTDQESTENLMERFINSGIDNHLYQYIEDAFVNAIHNRL